MVIAVPPSPRSRQLRRIGLGLAIVAFIVIGTLLWRSGLVTPSSIDAWLVSMGNWAPVLFVGAHILGSLIGLPTMAFLVAARLAFGPWLGFALGYGGGVIAVCIPFLTARALRRPEGEPWHPKGKWLGKAYDQIDSHPLRTVVLLRLFLWFNQPLSYALALTRVRRRDYVLGCAIGLAPIAGAAVFSAGWFTG